MRKLSKVLRFEIQQLAKEARSQAKEFINDDLQAKVWLINQFRPIIKALQSAVVELEKRGR